MLQKTSDGDSAATPAAGRVVQVSVSPGGVPKLSVGRARVRVARVGLEGDAQAHKGVHGGPHRAVCLFGLEAIRRVAVEGHPIAPGTVGENITTEGIELSTLAPGTRLAIGDELLLEISNPANPCDTIRGSFRDGRSGRISILTHPSDSRVYARVLVEGTVAEGDAVRVLPAAPGSEAALHVLLERLEANERRFWLAHWEAVATSGADLRILDLGDAVACAAPGLPGSHFNGAFGLRFVPDLRDRVLEHFRESGVAGWVHDLEAPRPGLEPESRDSILGCEPGEVADPAPVAGLTIREVGAAESVAWETILCDAFALDGPVRAAWLAAAPAIAAIPGQHLLVAELDGRPAGAAGLYLRARVGGLVPAAVLPWARGRGIHSALIAARARLAEAHGCTLLTGQAETDGTSERNMRRAGMGRLLVRGAYRVEPA
jgi:MOSC domain-containing protein YiiM